MWTSNHQTDWYNKGIDITTKREDRDEISLHCNNIAIRSVFISPPLVKMYHIYPKSADNDFFDP